jgi:hypothetical protein
MTEAAQNNNFLRDVVRVLLTAGSLLGLCGWVWVTLAIIGYSGFPQTSIDRAGFLYPYVYLPLTIYSCWSKVSRRTLLITAALLNLPIVAALVYAITDRGVPGIVVCSGFLLLWIARLV